MRKTFVLTIGLALLGTVALLGSAPAAQATQPGSKILVHDLSKKEKKVGPFTYVFQEYVVVEDFPLSSSSTPSTSAQIAGLLNEACSKSSYTGMAVELQAEGRTLAAGSMTQVPVSGVTSSQGSRTAAQYAAGFAKYQGLCQHAAKFPRVKKYPFYKMLFGNFGANTPAATLPAAALAGVRYTDPSVSTVCMISQGQILKCG